MIRVDVKKLEPGNIAAEDIVTKRGQTIAKAGTTLSAQLIARLSFYRIEQVAIEEAPAAEAPPEPENLAEMIAEVEEEEHPKAPEKEVINETISYSNRLKANPEYQDYQINYSKMIVTLESTFIDIIENNGANYSRASLLEAFSPLYHHKTSLDILTFLQNITEGNEDSVYVHSINVGLVSRAIGKWLKLGHDDLDDLTLAGLLHDIGKLNVPEEVLYKEGKLTDEEYDMIKKHPLDGRKMLKNCPAMDSRYLNAALQHHERSDGSGYPRGLTDDEIDDFAAIIAIADVYDAMTSARKYRSAMCAFEVIGAFEHDGLAKYRTQYILTFLERIANAYQNSLVMLSDGRRGRVVYLNSAKLSKPIVEMSDKSMIDLSRTPELKINSIL